MNQLDLFETSGQEPAKSPEQLQAEAARSADEGIERASRRHADWVERAKSVIQVYLVTYPEFFVDEFWAAEVIDEPENKKALGNIVRYAAKMGWMRKSGEYRSSIRSNNTEKPVWESLIYSRG